MSDAISNSDPDLLTKLSAAMTGGNARFLNDGANLLSGLLGGGGLASLAGALSQYAGAPHRRDADAARRGHPRGGWHDRPAGPVELVGPVGDPLVVQQPEERDRRRVAA